MTMGHMHIPTRLIITDDRGLDALPLKSVILDQDGTAWQKFEDGWYCTTGSGYADATPAAILADGTHYNVIHQGDA
jgi:hypothetical protein